jgi:argininosuccinate lyase
VAKLVKYAASEQTALSSLSLDQYKKYSDLFEKDVYDITLEHSVEARAALGGTAPSQVKAAIKRARILLKDSRRA